VRNWWVRRTADQGAFERIPSRSAFSNRICLAKALDVGTASPGFAGSLDTVPDLLSAAALWQGAQAYSG
jgi:hypothetical protein